MGEFNSLGTIRPHYKGHARNKRAYVKDADLQVYVPSHRYAEGMARFEDTHSFHIALSQYLEVMSALPCEAVSELEGITPRETADISQVMLAVDQVDAGFQAMMDIHNKLISAYNEVMRSKETP